MEPVIIKGKPIGDGYETVFLGEIGSIFDKNNKEARDLITVAAESGVDFLKAEILRNADFSLNDEYVYTYSYGNNGKSKSEVHRKIVSRKTNSLDFYREIFEYSRSFGLEFIVSVYDLESIAFLKEIDAAAIKIPSGNINHEPMIREASRTGLPLIIDTGNAYMDEVGRAFTWTRQYGANGVIFQHHPGKNPASAEAHHLRIMQTYKEAFDVPVGLACHYIGDEILYTAIGMGANTIEKPVSFDPNKEDVDAIYALEAKDLKKVVQKVKSCWKAIGVAPRVYTPNRDLKQRMGLVTKKKISPGDRINYDNVRFALPCKGVSVEHWSIVENKTFRFSINESEPIHWKDIDFQTNGNN